MSDLRKDFEALIDRTVQHGGRVAIKMGDTERAGLFKPGLSRELVGRLLVHMAERVVREHKK